MLIRVSEMKADADSPSVLIFAEKLLPISETFIRNQVLHLSHFVPRYVGLGKARDSLPLRPDTIVLTSTQSTFSELRQKIYRRIGVAPVFHRRVRSLGTNLIHAHFGNGGRSALPLSHHLKIPLVVTLHGSDVTRRIDFGKYYGRLWRHASAFICVSKFIRQKALDAGFPRQKLLVHYIGIDRDVFETKQRVDRLDIVLFVGRLVEKKGCAFLLRAMAKVQRQHVGIKTVVIGDGPLRASLEKLADDLGVHCQFLGAQPADAVRNWLASARIFCAPSVTASNGETEGAPIVILEAQAMRVPVVSTRHAGIPEVVLDGKTGLLAPETNSDVLALHIQRFLTDERFSRQCVEYAFARLQSQFDIRLQTQRLETLYGRVCDPNWRLNSALPEPNFSVI
jgi:colanic acid/amylovoran biosynthesis glycosyltransferase